MENKVTFQAKDISKKIRGKLVIDRLSLDLYSNEIFGLLGLNGAGKSTIIKLIVGLLKPDAGFINLLGINPKEGFDKYISKIGVSYDDSVLYEFMTGYQNLIHFSSYYKSTMSDLKGIIHMLNLEKIINDKVSTYSMGMKQKLNIGQAILHSPRFLILDEPTNGLDPKAIKELRDLLLAYKKKSNATILISSHNLLEIENLCDRIGIIDEGKLKQIYNAQEINDLYKTKNYSLEEIFLNTVDREVGRNEKGNTTF